MMVSVHGCFETRVFRIVLCRTRVKVKIDDRSYQDVLQCTALEKNDSRLYCCLCCASIFAESPCAPVEQPHTQ